jgi:hypothetical protein
MDGIIPSNPPTFLGEPEKSGVMKNCAKSFGISEAKSDHLDSLYPIST